MARKTVREESMIFLLNDRDRGGTLAGRLRDTARLSTVAEPPCVNGKADRGSVSEQ